MNKLNKLNRELSSQNHIEEAIFENKLFGICFFILILNRSHQISVNEYGIVLFFIRTLIFSMYKNLPNEPTPVEITTN